MNNRVLRFAVSSKNVRNNVIDIVKTYLTCEGFSEDLCSHLREFKRHCLDVYNEIIFLLPKGITLIIMTSLVDGRRLQYDVSELPSVPHKDFQKVRWWKFGRV